ncbi:ABC transporter permease [Pseudonocardia benzenivorans]
MRRILAGRVGVVSVAVLAVIALLAAFGPLLAPHDPLLQDPRAILAGPSAQHWLGTDNLGRDVLSRLLAGSTLSLVAGVEAVAVGLVLGVVPALLSVHLGRVVEWVSLRVMETFVTLPFLVFAVAMTALLGNGLQQAMLAVGILIAPASTGSPAPRRCPSRPPSTSRPPCSPAPRRGPSCAGTCGPRSSPPSR